MLIGGLAETGGGFALGFLAGYAAQGLLEIALFATSTGVVLGCLAERRGYAKIG